MRNAVVIDRSDSVAVAIHPLSAGDVAVCALPDGSEEELPVREDIARYKRVPEEKSQEEATRILADLQRQLADAVPKEER